MQEAGCWESLPHSRGSLAETGGKSCASLGTGASGRRPGRGSVQGALRGVAGMPAC